MGAKDMGAAAPTASITVRDYTIDVNPDALNSWEAFGQMRILSASEDVFAKADAAFALVELATGKGMDEVAGMVGGGKASAQDVLSFALEIIAAATPKN